ncbi:MAG TPA: Rieske 2Fe-2S domain-containing protein [Rhodanobacteraceae bacterium]|nr:Rieske 2Fe-2S domain-containing protein [Rhodanobacteraceae bacterium]
MTANQNVKPLGLQAPLCRLEDIPDGGARGVSVQVGEQWDLILLRHGEAVRAFHNECPHAGRNLDYAPGQFLVRGQRITCAVHGAVFDTQSGACCGGPARSGLVAVPLTVVDGAVWLAAALAADTP